MKTSIIMTSFNYENFIATAIESVINQTIPDWELIIIDDGSKDNSLKIIEKYCQKDNRIKLFTHPNNQNMGLCESVKLGLEKAQNEWVAFLESDDYWTPNYLEEKYKFITKHPNINFVYNDVSCFGNCKKITKTKTYFEQLHKIWQGKDTQNMFDYFGTTNFVPTFSCVMCKKDLLLNCNIDTPCDPVLDYWIWWQMSEENDFGFLTQQLTNWQLHKTSYLKESSKDFSFYLKRSLFIPNILKFLKRKPKLSLSNKIETIKHIAKIKYCLLYIKKQLLLLIKSLFIAS